MSVVHNYETWIGLRSLDSSLEVGASIPLVRVVSCHHERLKMR